MSAPENIMVARAERDAAQAEAERLRGERDSLAQSYSLMTEHRDQLRGERDRLKDALDRARDTVGDLRRRAEACTPFVVGHLDAGRKVDAERCMGKRQAYGHARRLLALALHMGEADAPEGERP